MKNLPVTCEIVEQVYKNHNEVLILGLSGVTGAGCTIARKSIVSNELVTTDCSKNKDNRLRDKVIIEKFLRVNWQHFTDIRGRYVLTLYILQNHENFEKLILKPICIDSASGEISSRWEKIIQGVDPEYLGDKLKAKIKSATGEFGEIDQGFRVFLVHNLPKLSDDINTLLKDMGKRMTNHLVYQNVSVLLRCFGKIPSKLPTQIVPGALFTIAKGLDLLVRAHKREYEHKLGELRIVIDKIENPFEVEYLRNKYANFYLIAMSAKEDKRKDHLEEKGFEQDEMFMLNASERPWTTRKEYRMWEKRRPEEHKLEVNKPIDMYFRNLGIGDGNGLKSLWLDAYKNSTFPFHLPDIEACIQNADIIIDYELLVEDTVSPVLARYLSLILHPGLVQPTDDERFMQIAQTVKVSSGCISRQVGAVVCNAQSEILGVGWNDPSALPGNESISCSRRNLMDWCKGLDDVAYSEFEKNDQRYRKHIYRSANSEDPLISGEDFQMHLESLRKNLMGLPYAFCFKDLFCNYMGNPEASNTRAQHGEERALEKCSRNETIGGTVYCTSSSCELCSKKILHYGIKRIVYIEHYPGISESHILGHTGAGGRVSLELFSGACNRAYVKLYTPIFPLKDELTYRGMEFNSKSKEQREEEAISELCEARKVCSEGEGGYSINEGR